MEKFKRITDELFDDKNAVDSRWYKQVVGGTNTRSPTSSQSPVDDSIPVYDRDRDNDYDAVLDDDLQES